MWNKKLGYMSSSDNLIAVKKVKKLNQIQKSLPVNAQASMTDLNFISSYGFPNSILSRMVPRMSHGSCDTYPKPEDMI